MKKVLIVHVLKMYKYNILDIPEWIYVFSFLNQLKNIIFLDDKTCISYVLIYFLIRDHP